VKKFEKLLYTKQYSGQKLVTYSTYIIYLFVKKKSVGICSKEACTSKLQQYKLQRARYKLKSLCFQTIYMDILMENKTSFSLQPLAGTGDANGRQVKTRWCPKS